MPVLALAVPTAALWAALAALALVSLGLALALRAQVRRNAAAARRAADRHRVLLDLAGDAVFVHDGRGGAVEPNAAARVRLGLGEGAAAPPLRDLTAPDDHGRLGAHLDALAAGGAARTDLRLVGPDGEVHVEVDSRVVPLGDGDRVLSVGRDVGARRAREAALEAERDAAVAAVRDKSALLDSLSHDLRTPLTSVLGFAELLRDEVGPESRGLVQAIESGGRRVLTTLGAILDLARLDAGRETVHPAPLDAVAHVRRSVARFEARAAERDLDLAVEAASEEAAAVLDAGLVDRVLGTLVENALAFTERGGVTVEVAADADLVTLRVIDTGSGIPADVLPDLFSEHRLQPGGPGQDDVGATALGLAVIHRLVDLAGGTISAESQRGAGTAFTVTLPRGDVGAPASPDRPAQSRPAPGRPARPESALAA